VRRTRKALHEALLSLMIEKGYEAVTVADIIERADVGRSTFYTHYTDKDALLRDGFADLRALIEQPDPAQPRGARPLLGFSLPMFRHVHEQRRLARALLGQPRTPVLRQLEKLLTGIVEAELSKLRKGKREHAVPHEALVRYVVGAHLSLLEWWLTAHPAMEPEEMDHIFQALVTPGIKAALDM
jgi:AcrR family transcriptional regulator